jgi:hypothetical protein
LPTVLQSGAPAFAEANGMSFFQYIAADPTRSATMGKFMAGIYGSEGPKIAAGYDAYMIKSVLHDWDDGKAVQILRQCRDAMPSHGRVLLIETVVSPGQPMGHPHPRIDLEMMVTFGGKERTEREFATLLSSAGLTLEQVTPINGSFCSLVEATPA